MTSPSPGPPSGPPNLHIVAPPPPRKKNPWWLTVLLVVVFLVLLGLCVAFIVVVSNKQPMATLPSAATTSTVTAAPPRQSPQIAGPRAPQTVLDVKGNEPTQTPIFITADEWVLNYTFDCATSGGTGALQVYEYSGKGDLTKILVKVMGKSGNSLIPVHADPGAHYLSIVSGCSWTVRASS